MIYYVGSYRSANIEERNPQGSYAEDVKMAYIISVIKKLKKEVTVVSVLASLNHGFHRRKTCKIDEYETQIFLESYDETRKGLSKLGVIQRLTSLFLFLLLYTNNNDTVIVYNTQLFSVPVRLAKWFKRFKLVLEIEELFYMDERNPKDVARKPLEEALVASADAYILASKLLAARIVPNKPYAVVYGGYSIPPQYTERRKDGYIHVVYAGGIDSLRRVDLAVRAFMLLPNQYRFHILGFGSEEDIGNLLETIEDINLSAGFDKVEFVGYLSGKEYDVFLQSCHIGLNMQLIGTSIEEVAFPSKISSYLSRGLNVVSGNLKSVRNSPLAKGISFFSENSEEEIAKAILECKCQPKEEQVKLIQMAEQQFSADFIRII